MYIGILDRYVRVDIRQVSGFGLLLKSPVQHVAENRLNREFTAEKPNMKWCTDVTELKYGNGKKAYLSAIIDLHDGSNVSYELGHSNNKHVILFMYCTVKYLEEQGYSIPFNSDIDDSKIKLGMTYEDVYEIVKKKVFSMDNSRIYTNESRNNTKVTTDLYI